MSTKLNEKLINFTSIFHMLISLFILYIASNSGEAFKFSVIPYIVYLTYNFNPKFYPSLIVLSSGSTIISFEVMIITFLFALYKTKSLIFSSLKSIYILIIFLVPLFIFHFFDYLRFGFIEALNANVYYISFFSIFYGFLIGKKINILNISLIFFPLFMIYFLYSIGFQLEFGQEFSRSSTLFSIICITVLGSIFVFKNIFNQINKSILFVSLSYFLSTVIQYGLKFHVVFSILISLLLLFQIYRVKPFFRKYIQILILVLPFLFIYSVLNLKYVSEGSLDDIDYTKIFNYPTYILQKLFDDRGTIWKGAIDVIKSSNVLLPPNTKILINYESSNGGLITYSDIAIHNLYLEFILRLGWIWSIILFYVLYILIIKLFRNIWLFRQDLQYVLLSSIVIGLFIGGSITGQYILLSNFGFLMMSLFGVLIGYSEKR